MKKKEKIILSIIILAALVLILYSASKSISSLTGHAVDNNNLDDFAKCLTKKGVKMYGASWCGHCQNQKAMFGDSFQYIDYTECTENPDKCSQTGVQGYPTWEINNKLFPREQSLEKLAELSGCK